MKINTKAEMTTEYRIGMMIAFGLALLSMLLPLASVSVLGTKIRVSLIDVFRTSKLEKLGIFSGLFESMILIRIFVGIAIVLLVAGLVCYALDWTSRIKEGLVIWLLTSIRSFYASLFLILLSVAFVASLSDANIRVGLGAVVGFIATQYLFFRPMVFLCTCKTTDGKSLSESVVGQPILQKPLQKQPVMQPPHNPVQVPQRIPALSGAKGELHGISGIYKDQIISLKDGERLIMGRSSKDSNLIVNAPKVSRKHCEVVFDQRRDVFIIYDYSSNGTYLGNGMRCGKESTLRSGGTFYLGDRNNMFQVK